MAFVDLCLSENRYMLRFFCRPPIAKIQAKLQLCALTLWSVMSVRWNLSLVPMARNHMEQRLRKTLVNAVVVNSINSISAGMECKNAVA